jgi:hypothetical protein
MFVLTVFDREECIIHEPFLFYKLEDALNEIKTDIQDHDEPYDDIEEIYKEIVKRIKTHGHYTYNNDVVYYVDNVEPK